MKRKWWPWLIGGAVIAVALALGGVLPKNAGDFAWGLATGLTISAALSWFAERGV